ncbi:MAG: tetraacyldisaccharide 4'-kinase [Proteobacteria bacterium]|nr:tetraacyldisaccharide 4'-kinase [Pseudomonadota bacterium]
MAQGRKINLYGFCGLAKPVSFRNTLKEAGFNLTGFKQFQDHYAYAYDEVVALIAEARLSGAKGLITTQKDYVKLATMHVDFPVFSLRVELIPEPGFDDFILTRI